ncbi:hypothetical protein G9A89_022038 [Geosiphon pyriformis]|nr:hypothetical protein G9A89_022038 [Geosiphon pyriformis]
MSAMVGNQVIESVLQGGELELYMIIKILNYKINRANVANPGIRSATKVMMIYTFEVVKNPGYLLGNPSGLNEPPIVTPGIPVQAHQNRQPPFRQQPTQQIQQHGYHPTSAQQIQQQNSQNDVAYIQHRPQAAPTRAFNSDNEFNDTRSHGSPNLNSQSRTNEGTTIFPIDNLNPYQNKWIIRARVTQKSEMKHWHNARGQGKLFSFNLLDESGEIKATAFKEAADKFYDLIEENKVYEISKGKVVLAKKNFSNIDNEYEIHLEIDSVVTLRSEAEISVPNVQYNFVPLNKLMDYNKDSTIDVIGIVKEDQGSNEIISKTTQKAITKRELLLVDQTHFQVKVTMWGKLAETFDSSDLPVIAVKKIRVGDYQGRNLSLYGSSTLNVNPDIPEARQLRDWYRTLPSDETFQTYLGITGPNSSPSLPPAERKTVGQILDGNIGKGDKSEVFSVKATINFVKPESSFCYPACPSCNKKLIGASSEQWQCEKCNNTYPSPHYRYIFSFGVADHTGQMWISTFNDAAEQILGIDAGRLNQLRIDDNALFTKTFKAMNFKTYIFTCRAKSETYQETERIKYTLLQARSVDHIAEGRELLKMIKTYSF